MGIGIVIILWLMLFGIVAAIFGIIKYLARSFYIFDVIKDAFKSIVLVFLLLISIGIIGGGIDFILDHFFPSHVFSHCFGFSPTPDVKNLEGVRTGFVDSGYANLKFQADKSTVERIINEQNFVTDTKGSYQGSSDDNFREFLNRPDSKFYSSEKFKSEFVLRSAATIIYDEKSKQVYFTWNGFD